LVSIKFGQFKLFQIKLKLAAGSTSQPLCRSPRSADGWGPSHGLAHSPASSLPPSLSPSLPGNPTCEAPLTSRSPHPPAPSRARAHPPMSPHAAAQAPNPSPSPRVEPLAACRSRGRRTPLLPFYFFHARPPCLTPTCLRASPSSC
jgi:hypothetical protein